MCPGTGSCEIQEQCGLRGSGVEERGSNGILQRNHSETGQSMPRRCYNVYDLRFLHGTFQQSLALGLSFFFMSYVRVMIQSHIEDEFRNRRFRVTVRFISVFVLYIFQSLFIFLVQV